MSTVGIIRMQAVLNNAEARKDWQKMVARAEAVGLEKLAASLFPGPEAGWRRLDRARHVLQDAVEIRENAADGLTFFPETWDED